MLAVVILNYGMPDDTLALASKLTAEGEVSAVVVVDNYSNGENLRRLSSGLRDFHSSKLHFLPLEDNLGYGAGNNVGLRYAFAELKADYGLVLNPDIEILGDFSPVISKLGSPNECFIFTGRVNQHGSDHSILLYKPWTCRTANGHADASGPLYIPGCCFGFTKGIWEAFGGFWEGYFLQFEELDYIYRYRSYYGDFPKVLVDTGIFIRHYEGATTGSSPRNASPSSDYWAARSRIVFYRQFHLKKTVVAIIYNGLKAVYSFTMVRPRNVVSIFRGTFDGFRAKC